MKKNLVIVESPAKAKTIEKFLGKDYKVVASYGHVRDLPKAKLGVDIEHNFEPQYIIPRASRKHVANLQNEVRQARSIYLATDLDREGEAIAWHIQQILKVPKDFPKYRITFHEITKSAIEEAIHQPRQINMNLVNAQQARRVLDRLVGYKLSPFLWHKVRRGLSAGRVQSVAVRFIVEREREIENFVPREYWKIIAFFTQKDKREEFKAELVDFRDGKIEIKNQEEASKITSDLKDAEFKIRDIQKKETKRQTPPPFITSTLQQEAARKLGFSAKKTMLIAQQLYEGIDLGPEGHRGLITYMRTDSVNLAKEALGAIRSVILEKFGQPYLAPEEKIYQTKTKSAQEAHEAIRPTQPGFDPEKAKVYLSRDQARLYSLIWKRTLASQMADAIFDSTAVEISAKDYLFKSTGQVCKFDGFLKIYEEGSDENNKENGEGKESKLPELKIGEVVEKKSIEEQQHFTKPPLRYSEASLVKILEQNGIGRPSTYAPIMSTIIDRGYVIREQRRFYATEIGKIVNDLLVEHFPEIVDINFTAKLEEELDDIAEGKIEWVPVVKKFWDPFIKNLELKEAEIKKEDIIPEEKTNEICNLCGSPMMIKFGRFGKFLACSRFPECKSTRPLTETEEEKKELSEEKCEKCGADLVLKKSRFGEFLACSRYPECKFTKSIGLPEIKMKCPKCGAGDVVAKKTKRGKIFFGCSRYPNCDWASWMNPKEGAEEKDSQS